MDEQTNILTRNLEAEAAVLGSMLIDERCIDQVTGKLKAEDFSAETYQDVFRAISTMQREGRRADPVTVMEQMRSDGTYDEKTTRSLMMQLMEITPTAANAMAYADGVKLARQRRELLALSNNISESVQKEAPPGKILQAINRNTERIQQAEASRMLITSEEASARLMDDMANRYKFGAGYKVVSTGYQDIDRVLGGFLKGGFFILAGRPGMGKSTLALNIADRVSKQGPVLYVSMEMDCEELKAKLLAMYTGIDSQKLLIGDRFSDDEWVSIAEAQALTSKLPLITNDQMDVTIDDIGAMARGIKGLKLLIIDYCGLLRLPNRQQRRDEISDLSRSIKLLAMQMKIPVLGLLQLNRAVEARENKDPLLSDLRDSGAWEQDADAVLFVNRSDFYTREPGDTSPSPATVTIAKNRHGATGKVPMEFDVVHSQFLSTKNTPVPEEL